MKYVLLCGLLSVTCGQLYAGELVPYEGYYRQELKYEKNQAKGDEGVARYISIGCGGCAMVCGAAALCSANVGEQSRLFFMSAATGASAIAAHFFEKSVAKKREDIENELSKKNQ